MMSKLRRTITPKRPSRKRPALTKRTCSRGTVMSYVAFAQQNCADHGDQEQNGNDLEGEQVLGKKKFAQRSSGSGQGRERRGIVKPRVDERPGENSADGED